MSSQEVVILVVAVVVALLLLGLVVLLARRRNRAQAEARREHAGRLREKAVTHTEDLHRSELEVEEAEAEAAAARARAARAEAEAGEVRQSAAVEEARHEHVLREADRVDPDVDHRADDYRPTTPTTEGPTRPDGGSHRA